MRAFGLCFRGLPAWLVTACAPAEVPGRETSGGEASSGTGQYPEITSSAPTTETGESPQSMTGSVTATTTVVSETGLETTGPGYEPVCGDAHVDPGEECDAGPANRDDGACTLDCKTAECGDGLVHEGVEECDEGEDNGDDHNGCSPACTSNGFCGDGIVQIPDELCDEGAANGDGMSSGGKASCGIGCVWDARVVFATSILLSGNLGGLDTADEICQARAAAGDLPRHETYKAWLSAGAESPITRFTLLPAKAYVLRTGDPVADSLTDLANDGPIDGIRVDEFGAPIPPSPVWTGTAVDGTPHVPDDFCGGWESEWSELYALIGLSHLPHEPEVDWESWKANKWWTNYDGKQRKCNNTYRLYCFEQ